MKITILAPRPSVLALSSCVVLACHRDPPATSDTDGASSTSSSGTEPEIPGPTPTSSPSATSSSATDAPTTTDPPDPGGSSADTDTAGRCGDGQLDADEQCDDGVDNSDAAACTLDCTVAVCGDGKLHVGVEACDLGVDNSDAYGGCGANCQPNRFCGDGVLDPEEQCDTGIKNGSGESPDTTVPCTTGCRWDARLAFLSSELHHGDFGGLDGADLWCRTRAKQANIAAWPTFRAWLSDADQGPLERFTLLPARPYVLPTGERIADSLGDLVLNGPRDGIRVDEFGKPLPPSLVWTNTSVAAAPFSPLDHCQAWDSASPELIARVGRSHLPKQPADQWKTWHDERQWTSLMYLKCSGMARLYCFEN